MDPNVFETANAGFAQVMYEEFLRDPASVDAEWRQLFESGVVGEAPAASNGARRRRGTGSGRARAARPAPATAAPAPSAPSTPVTATASRTPDQGTGRAPRTEHEREPHASRPRPPSVNCRWRSWRAPGRQLNDALKQAGRTEKISFTHLIAWAIVRGHEAASGHGPHLRRAGRTAGPDHAGRHQPRPRGGCHPQGRQPRPGGARHQGRGGDGLCAASCAAYEGLVEKARVNKLMPDDFAGATMSLTNPGGLGTRASVPRLMVGQGSIIAVGVDRLSARVRDASRPERVRRARHLEGDDDQQHVRPPDHPGCRVGGVPGRGRCHAAGRRRVLRRRRRSLWRRRWPR